MLVEEGIKFKQKYGNIFEKFNQTQLSLIVEV